MHEAVIFDTLDSIPTIHSCRVPNCGPCPHGRRQRTMGGSGPREGGEIMVGRRTDRGPSGDIPPTCRNKGSISTYQRRVSWIMLVRKRNSHSPKKNARIGVLTTAWWFGGRNQNKDLVTQIIGLVWLCDPNYNNVIDIWLPKLYQ